MYTIKKALKTQLLLGSALMMLAGCLKDKGYEDGDYGTITNKTEGDKFISIPIASRNPNVVGIESKAGKQPVELFTLSYDYKSPAETDLAVTVAVNNSLITDPTVKILPPSEYDIPSLTHTIKAGQVISDPFMANINTGNLDPNFKYGIAFSITNVPSGIEIPSNLKNVILLFTIKNKYDGIYSFRGRHDMASDRSSAWLRTPYDYPYEIHLITAGPNTVRFFNTAFNAGFHPLMTPGVSGFGSTEPVFTFDANNNIVTVVNGFPNPSNGRAFVINSAVSGSKYNPSNKKVYAAYIMNQPGFEPMPLFDTLTFIKKRP